MMTSSIVRSGEWEKTVSFAGNSWLLRIRANRIYSGSRASFQVYVYIDGEPRWRVWGGYLTREARVVDVELPVWEADIAGFECHMTRELEAFATDCFDL